MNIEQEPSVWQAAGGWYIHAHQPNREGAVLVFATRNEAIAYFTSTYLDGASAAQAETQHGAVQMTPEDIQAS